MSHISMDFWIFTNTSPFSEVNFNAGLLDSMADIFPNMSGSWSFTIADDLMNKESKTIREFVVDCHLKIAVVAHFIFGYLGS